jgi:uncharacterized protein YfaS (alpha-2-macroglobulin family)
VQTDKSTYNPGDTANLLIHGSARNVRTLVIVEAPDASIYQWVDLEEGEARTTIPVKASYVPDLPVHVIMMQGRTTRDSSKTGLVPESEKPVTLATTTWLHINPDRNRVRVDLEYPPRVLPGEEIPITIRLKDFRDKSLTGEVTLWVVEQAVSGTSEKDDFDPLPAFIPRVRSVISIHDTRSFLFDSSSLSNPARGTGNRTTAEAFMSADAVHEVPGDHGNIEQLIYYNPGIHTRSRGTVTIRIKLPTTPAHFEIRAAATSGPDRFGFAKGELAVVGPGQHP